MRNPAARHSVLPPGTEAEAGSAEAAAAKTAEVGEPDSAARLGSLMARYAAGDATAFGHLFAALASRIYGFHLRMIGNRAMAEDLTQQTFLKLHVARRRYREDSAVEPWIFAIARNVQRDRWRAKRRSREQLSADGVLPEPATGAPAFEQADPFARDRLAHALQALPEGQREVVVLHKLEGMALRDVAEILDIGLSAAKVRAFRAYGKLRELMEGPTPHETTRRDRASDRDDDGHERSRPSDRDEPSGER